MPGISTIGTTRTMQHRHLLWLLFFVPVLVSLGGVWILDHAKANKPLFSMTNLVGPTTRSLLAGQGLTACTDEMSTPGNPICFHAARMPMSALVVGMGIRLFGDHYLRVACFKTLIFLLPVGFCVYLVWRSLPRSGGRRLLVILLLLAPFTMTAFLADVTNILVDEGYLYSFIAVAVALLFFDRQARLAMGEWTRAVMFAVAVDGIYLSKSGALPVVVVLTAGFLLVEYRPGLRWLVLVLVAVAPLGWALHQHHASGRYSVGTSFDGINLHKGNNAGFLEHFPPPRGDSMDRYDRELNRGLHFGDEWIFNDYHQRAALDYVRAHPRETLQGDWRKLNVLFLSGEKYGGTASHGVTRMIEDVGLLVFRLMLWAAIASTVYVLIRVRSTRGSGREENEIGRSLRIASGIFLALVAACALPYVAGFAYTRHVSVLIYPTNLVSKCDCI